LQLLQTTVVVYANQHGMVTMPHTQEHQQVVVGYAHNAGLNQQSTSTPFIFKTLHLLLTVQLQHLHSAVVVYAVSLQLADLQCNQGMVEESTSLAM